MREAEHLAHPFDDLAFDLDWHVIAPAEIGVEPRRQHFRQHADRGAAAVHPAHEARMHIAGGIGNDEVGEFPVDFIEIGSVARKGFAKPGADRLGYRLPDRAIPDVGGIVEHVVEHAMTKRADLVPVIGIERRARFRPQRRLAQRLGHAACSCPPLARRSSMAAKASKIRRICGGL